MKVLEYTPSNQRFCHFSFFIRPRYLDTLISIATPGRYQTRRRMPGSRGLNRHNIWRQYCKWRGRSDSGGKRTLFISVDAACIYAHRQKGQVDAYGRAISRLAIDLNPALMIINDAVHGRQA
jgi:hypothetical protein